MARIFGNCARYLFNLCLMLAVIFMLACTVLVIALIAKSDIHIEIHRIEEDRK